jgi:hydrogenase maturation factor
MNLVYGEIVDLFLEDGIQMGNVRVFGAMKKVPLELLTDAQPGDTILMCDGVGISKVAAAAQTEKSDVPRDSR